MKRLSFGLAVAAVGLILAWFALGSSPSSSRIDGARAKELVAAGARLVDVRTSAEYSAKHLPGALNVPVQELSSRISELEPKSQPIVVYCRSGHRSGNAAAQLKSAGFGQVYDLGPMTAW